MTVVDPADGLTTRPPWDIPPFPAEGDRDIKVLYAAKGSAVSAWEKIEVSLCYLYAHFCGEPWDKVEAYRRYGEWPNFKDRLELLERAAEAYFIRNCDQSDEGTFCFLMRQIRLFQPRRNEITHSVVTYRLLTDGNEYFLLPPEYSVKKFDQDDKAKFVYTSIEIDEFDIQFRRLSLELDVLAASLHLRAEIGEAG